MQFICPSSSEVRGGVSHYKACHGTDYDAIKDGIFFQNSRIRIRDIRDGTSNTIAMGEASGSIMTNSLDHNNWWGVGGAQVVAETIGPINPHTGLTRYYQLFSSSHEGGAFFMMCDGQVRFLSENIDMSTYKALATRANNELIDDEDY